MRVIGPSIALTGLFLFVYGVYDFSQAFGDFDKSPDKFWMCFLGVPMLGIGVMLTKFAFLGAAARYVAGETVPVATDSLNYVAHGAKDGIREVVGAVRDGLRDDRDDRGPAGCPACGEPNDADANFCDNCGAPIASKSFCPSCGAENDGDANFCSGCGAGMS